MATTRTRTLLTGSAIAMLMSSGAAFAQDATIHYETPLIKSGQPVLNPTPVLTPVRVYEPVPVEAQAGASIPATQATVDDESYLGTPVPQVSGDVTFVSGGIGAYEKQWFEAHSGEYNLKVTYADTTGHHLSGVNATLADGSNTVLNTTTQGPYLLVKAKPGTYTLTSSYEGANQSKKVTIGKGTARTSVTFADTNPDL